MCPCHALEIGRQSDATARQTETLVYPPSVALLQPMVAPLSLIKAPPAAHLRTPISQIARDERNEAPVLPVSALLSPSVASDMLPSLYGKTSRSSSLFHRRSSQKPPALSLSQESQEHGDFVYRRGSKCHAYPKDVAPYPLSYEREVMEL